MRASSNVLFKLCETYLCLQTDEIFQNALNVSVLAFLFGTFPRVKDLMRASALSLCHPHHTL